MSVCTICRSISRGGIKLLLLRGVLLRLENLVIYHPCMHQFCISNYHQHLPYCRAG